MVKEDHENKTKVKLPLRFEKRRSSAKELNSRQELETSEAS